MVRTFQDKIKMLSNDKIDTILNEMNDLNKIDKLSSSIKIKATNDVYKLDLDEICNSLLETDDRKYLKSAAKHLQESLRSDIDSRFILETLAESYNITISDLTNIYEKIYGKLPFYEDNEFNNRTTRSLLNEKRELDKCLKLAGVKSKLQ